VGITLKIFHQPIFDSQKPLPTTWQHPWKQH
jgi:hypothetical protein